MRGQMKIDKLKGLLCVMLTMVLLLPLCCTTEAQAADRQNKKIRVGYYQLNQFQEVDEDGCYMGYVCEYYEEIAQYTGWEYEYVQESYADCIRMLENGEIDLMCGLNDRDTEGSVLEYSKYSIGDLHMTLYASNGREDLTYDDAAELNGRTVGIQQGNEQEFLLDEYLDEKGIDMKRRYASSMDELWHALEVGDIDVVYANEMSEADNKKVVAYMDPVSLYLISQKSSSLIEQIDRAMNQISVNSPEFELSLKQKYTRTNVVRFPSFTKAELAYIEQNPVVRIIYAGGLPPFEYTDEASGEFKGISSDILKLVTQFSGLRFECEPSGAFSDTVKRLQNGETDMLATVVRDYNWVDQYDLYLTNAYLETPYCMLTRRTQQVDDIQTVALSEGYYISDKLKQRYARQNIIYYPNVLECIQAVKDGTADAAYVNNYVANYYLNTNRFRSLRRVGQTEYGGSFAMAISKDCDPLLLSIINKSLSCITETELNTIILNNTMQGAESASLLDYVYEHPVNVLVMILVVAALVVLVCLYITWLKNQSVKRIEETSRMDGLTGLCNRKETERLVRQVLEDGKVKQTKSLIISIDLDNFKKVNDTYGHVEGDVLLQHVAQALKSCLKDDQIVGRMGGDEFLICIPGIQNANYGVLWGVKIQNVIMKLSQSKKEWSCISLSMGIVITHGAMDESFEMVYQRVDDTLYQAKNAGKNCYRIYEEK